MRRAAWILLAVAASACSLPMGRPVEPMPTYLVAAPMPRTEPHRIVVVLPGRGDDIAGLREAGIAEAIQASAPDTDVLLAGATLAYYLDGGLPRRLAAQIGQLRAAGYQEIWLAGASMGGMGALIYERTHPGDVEGLLLMAPFMGDSGEVEAVAAAGGPRQWEPGPAPAGIDRDNAAREAWRVVHGWALDPDQAQRVWLVCGAEDRLAGASRLIASTLPKDHYLERPGGHKWKVWAPAAGEVIEQATQTLIGARDR